MDMVTGKLSMVTLLPRWMFGSIPWPWKDSVSLPQCSGDVRGVKGGPWSYSSELFMTVQTFYESAQNWKQIKVWKQKVLYFFGEQFYLIGSATVRYILVVCPGAVTSGLPEEGSVGPEGGNTAADRGTWGGGAGGETTDSQHFWHYRLQSWPRERFAMRQHGIVHNHWYSSRSAGLVGIFLDSVTCWQEIFSSSQHPLWPKS